MKYAHNHFKNLQVLNSASPMDICHLAYFGSIPWKTNSKFCSNCLFLATVQFQHLKRLSVIFNALSRSSNMTRNGFLFFHSFMLIKCLYARLSDLLWNAVNYIFAFVRMFCFAGLMFRLSLKYYLKLSLIKNLHGCCTSWHSRFLELLIFSCFVSIYRSKTKS